MILHRLLAVQVGIDDSLVKQKAFGTEDIFEMYVALLFLDPASTLAYQAVSLY